MIAYSYPATVANLTRLSAWVTALPPGCRASLTLSGDRVLLSLELPQTVDEQGEPEDQRGDEHQQVVVAQQPLR